MAASHSRTQTIFGLALICNLIWLGHALTGMPALYYVAYATGLAAVADLSHMAAVDELA